MKQRDQLGLFGEGASSSVAPEPRPPARPPARALRRLMVQSLGTDDEALALEREIARLVESHAAHASVVALDAARDLAWTELSFLALDTETTGLAPDDDRVIELAFVRMERGRETERFSALCHTGVSLPEAVFRMTGISDEMLAGERPFGEVCPRLLEAMAGADFIAAYNAPFDAAFLAAELARAGSALPDVPWVDPLVFIREVDRYKPGKKLTEASRRWGVSLERPHRALADALATGELLLRVAPFLPARTLEDLLEQQQRWSARQRLEDAAQTTRGEGDG